MARECDCQAGWTPYNKDAYAAVADSAISVTPTLEPDSAARDEINKLLAIVDRDLKDATESISPDWQFGIAYNAVLKLCTTLLRAEGYPRIVESARLAESRGRPKRSN